MYEISGKISFEGEDLFIKLEDISCSGDRDYRVSGKVKEEKEKLLTVSEKMIGVIVQAFNSYK